MPLAFDVHRFESIDSTNTWVMAQAREGAPEGLVAVADHQTAGRGRLGRVWEAPPGANVLMTVLLRPAPEVAPHLALSAVALAGRDAASSVAGAACSLKWPNDLVDEADRKLAGVLAETDGAGAIAVGIGMNVGWAPDGAARLGDGPGVSRDAVVDALLASLSSWLDAGWPVVASGYRAACSTVGRRVRVELVDGESFEGTAADVDDAGRLLVETPVCIRTIEVGDVVHLR
jgi:BirA family biotin operon repressor/biotin-[acetyl-CoA-carboxylase] ligase